METIIKMNEWNNNNKKENSTSHRIKRRDNHSFAFQATGMKQF